MRIAIISDIHGNLIALEAVLEDIAREAPDEIWCGGDIALFGPWASECIARVRDEGWPAVRGNTDVWITGDPQTIEKSHERKEIQDLADAHAISESDAEWLLGLALGHSGPGSMLMVHGTPESPFTGPEPDAPPGEFAPYEGHADVVVYGHVHRAFTRRLASGTLVCNPGSVGLPKDGETASYLLVGQQGAEWTLQHRRVPFDRDRVAERARELGEPIAHNYLERATGS